MKHSYTLVIGESVIQRDTMTDLQAKSANDQLTKDDSPARWVRIFAKDGKPKPLEKEVHTAILKRLNELPKCYARKIHGSRFMVGFPDIMGCINKQMFCIEVKRSSKEKATPKQLSELRKWAESGAKVGVAWSVGQALQIVGRS